MKLSSSAFLQIQLGLTERTYLQLHNIRWLKSFLTVVITWICWEMLLSGCWDFPSEWQTVRCQLFTALYKMKVDSYSLLNLDLDALCMISIVANLCYSYIVFSSRRPLFRLLVSNRNASNQKCEVDTFPRNLPFRCLERYLGSSFRFSKETLQGDEQDTTDCSTLQQSRRV